MKFEWELLEQNERNKNGGGKPHTYRAKLIGG